MIPVSSMMSWILQYSSIHLRRETITLGKQLRHTLPRMIKHSLDSTSSIVKIKLDNSMGGEVLLEEFGSTPLTATGEGPSVGGGIGIVSGGYSLATIIGASAVVPLPSSRSCYRVSMRSYHEHTTRIKCLILPISRTGFRAAIYFMLRKSLTVDAQIKVTLLACYGRCIMHIFVDFTATRVTLQTAWYRRWISEVCVVS